MSTSIIAETDLEVQIQTKNIEISGRPFQVARVTHSCWLLTDLSTNKVWQFSTGAAMWHQIAALQKFTPNLSIPQLPAKCPQHPSEKRAEWKRNQIILAQCGVRSCYSVDFPIYLPATTTPEATQPKQLPKPKIAGLLSPYAGLSQGQCKGWLNAHWSPLALDGWVTRDTGYCPHCYSGYRVAMDHMMAQKAA